MHVLAVCGMGFEAAIAAGPGVTPVCGLGPARVAAQLEALLAGSTAPPWAGIISFGCAGALDPSLAPGRWLLASAVLDAGETIATHPAWLDALRVRLPGARAGLLAGIDTPLASSAAKVRLWREHGAIAVDMESHAAARVARLHGLPFAVCRAVLDPAWRNLPPCVLAVLRDDGGGAAWAPLHALGALRADPRQLAQVCALAREAWMARRALRQARERLGGALALPAAVAAAVPSPVSARPGH